MAMDRRKFLKIAGISTVLGLGGKTAFHLFAPGDVEASLKDMPLAAGKKWAMVVDSGKLDDQIVDACIEACHKTHNVPDMGNSKWEIKWLWKDTFEHTFPDMGHAYTAEALEDQPFLLFCNHCTKPPCCRACPTKATWKRKKDGVVMMDPHRCIGCRFCMAACPYGARSFNWGDPRLAPKELNPEFPTNLEYPTRTKGVVEKCNFCSERITRGEYPACVVAANEFKEGALIFGDLDDPHSEVRMVLREHYSICRKPELGTGPNIYYLV
jgi:molybdopterin-containing oxidoreductase family iron-sulfur binding subunit